MKERINELIRKTKEIYAKYSLVTWVKQKYNPMGYSSRYRELLAPRILSRNDEHYLNVRELKYALSKSECRNVAITGVFGSGKSSIINTYVHSLTSCAKRKILRVSLSNFDEEHLKIDNNNELSYNNGVEAKIFRSIFFEANTHKTRQTHFGRITYISLCKAVGIAVGVLLAVVSIIVILCPQYLFATEYLHKLYLNTISIEIRHIIHIVCFYGALIWLAGCVIFLLSYLIRGSHHLRPSHIKADHFELEIPKEEPFFSKYLEEILYFLRAGRYEIVIFEDLDRLKNPKPLFLKLREINILLNESDVFCKHGRIIRFVYAIKDDVFLDEIRTKFFDYIISVVPILDKHNNGDFLISHYHKKLFAEIKEQDLLVLGMYIEGQRELVNIINEYALYKSRFIPNGSKSATKFLAMLIYKNLFPSDYAESYSGRGLLQSVFDKKSRFYDVLLKDANAQFQEATDAELVAKKSIEKTRGMILSVLAKQNITKLIINGKDYPLDGFAANDELFEQFERNKISKYVYQTDDDYATPEYDFKFKQLVEEADPDNTYNETMSHYYNDLVTAQLKKKKWSNKIEFTKKSALQNILQELDPLRAKEVMASMLVDKPSEKQVDILFVLLKEGYIIEDYASYMSYSYPGSLSNNDYFFVNSVLQDIALDYNYSLNKCSAVIKRLTSNHFSRKSILNIDLCDNLFSSQQEALIQPFVLTARDDVNFIIEYIHKGKYKKEFLMQLFNNWEGCVTKINGIEDDVARDVMWLKFFNFASNKLTILDEEKNIIEGKYDFLCDHCSELSYSHLRDFLFYHEIHFDKLQEPNINTQKLFDIILSEYHYYFQLNEYNLRVIFGDKYEIQSYSSILASANKVKDFVIQHINEVIPYFSENSVEEEEKAIVSLMNNENVEVNKLRNYLSKQKNKINADALTIKESAQIAYETNVIAVSWKNVSAYFKLNNKTEPIVAFIRKNINDLEHQHGAEQNTTLMALLFANNDVLTIEEYKRLAPCFASIAVDDAPNTLGDVEEERISILVENKMIAYDEDNVNFMNGYEPSVFAHYLVSVFEDFKEDDTFDESLLINEVGIAFLNSSATLEQKAYLLENYLSVDATGANVNEYAKLFCFYTNEFNDLKWVDATKTVGAMELYREGGDVWGVKMSLINKLNRSKKFDANFETRMLKSLHMEESYDKLTYNGSQTVKLDVNPENDELLFFLRDQNYYVSNVGEPVLGKRKVSMIHKPLK